MTPTVASMAVVAELMNVKVRGMSTFIVVSGTTFVENGTTVTTSVISEVLIAMETSVFEFS